MILDPQMLGNVGLYYCCYKLTLLGWNVMPTARNARGVDILVYSRDASCCKTVQVKALSKRSAVPLGSSVEGICGDFWIIINDAIVRPQAFVLTPDDVKDGAIRNEKHGKASFWLPARFYEQEQFKEAWQVFGTDRA